MAEVFSNNRTTKAQGGSMGFLQKQKVLESEKDDLERSLVALRQEFDEYKRLTTLEKEKLVEERERTCSNLKELLLNQSHTVDQVQTKVSAMKERVATHENGGSEGDIHIRLKLVENALFDLRSKYEEKVKTMEQEKARILEEKENTINGVKQALWDGGKGGSSSATTRGFTSSELQSEFSTLQRLQDLVSSLDAQLQASSNSNGNSAQVSQAYEKVIAIKEEKAAIAQALSDLQTEFEQRVTSLSAEKKSLIDEKASIHACLREVILLQLKDAQSVRARLVALKDETTNGKEGSGFEEMEVRLKLTETGLQNLLKQHEDKKHIIDTMRKELSSSGGSVVSHKSSSKSLALKTESKSLDFANGFAKVHQLRGILVFLDAQLRAAGAPEASVRSLQLDEETISRKTLVDLHRVVLQSKKQYLQERENTCACLHEVLVSREQEAQALRSQLNAWKREKGFAAGGDGGDEEDTSGITEMETRLKLVEGALAQVHNTYSKTLEQISVFKKLVLKEESITPSVESLETLGKSMIDVSNLRESCEKVQKVRPIVAFLQSQLSCAGAGNIALRAELRAGEDALHEMHKQFLAEKENTCACLTEVIALQESEAQIVRSKLEKLNAGGNVDTDEMETRLRLAERALKGLHAECEMDVHETAALREQRAISFENGNEPKLTNLKILAKVSQLRGVIHFIHAQLNAVIAEDEQEKSRSSSQPSIKSKARSAPRTTKPTMHVLDDDDHTPFDEMKELLKLHSEEIIRLRASVERRGHLIPRVLLFLFRVAFFGSLLAAAFYIAYVWNDSMTESTFNVVCAPTLPGSRITPESGVLTAPFWVPDKYKDEVFARLCDNTPRIQLELKDHNLIVTEMPHVPPSGQSNNDTRSEENRRGLFGSKSDAAKPKAHRYPAHKAFVTSSTILTVDSDGWHKEIQLPWAWSSGRQEQETTTTTTTTTTSAAEEKNVRQHQATRRARRNNH